MNTTMADGLNVPFTIVRVDDKNKQYTLESRAHHNYGALQNINKLNIQMTNIKLMQAPTETFDMHVEITRPLDTRRIRDLQFTMTQNKGQSVNLKCHSYCVELRFLNYLHEFNKNYKYEIVCKIAGSEKQEDEFLFSCTELRLTDCVKTAQRFASTMNRDLTNAYEYGVLYFCIRRHSNEGKDMMYNERLNKAVSMFRNTGCDAVLKAKDGDVRAHKSILSQNSEIFQTMLSIDMKEKQSGIINVPDVEKKVVNKMLDYLYTGELGELEDMTEALFKLAHRYELHDLCRRCEEYYTFNVKVDNDNIVEILKLTDLYELENLNKCSVNFTKSHEQELVKVPEYQDYLIKSINSDNLVAMLLLSEKYKLENLKESAVNFAKLHEEKLLTMDPKYREYVIQSINLDNVVNTLLLAVKYGLEDIKIGSFDFIKDNYHSMMEKEEFLNLFHSNGSLMKEFHVYMHEKKL